MPYFIKARNLPEEMTEAVGIVPAIGVIYPDHLLDDTTSWLECDGKYVNREEYPELFARIRYKFGRGFGLLFRLPDLQQFSADGCQLKHDPAAD